MTDPQPALQTSADVEALTVEAWVDLDPQVELVLKRRSDGLEIVFAPNRESYKAAIERGAVAFTPAEVKQLIALARYGEDGARVAEKAVLVKQTFPGAKLADVLHGAGEAML